MNVKHVVASMSILGLISSPTFAATNTNHKHKTHHHKTTHHIVREYREVDTMPVVTAPVTIETEPKVDTFTTILDSMNHNTGRAKPMPDWVNRIGVSGGANVDIKWGNRRPLYFGENEQRVALNDVYVNVNGTVNDWARAFASISYNNTSVNYSNAYGNNKLDLEQGFLTLGNLDVSPFFVQVGKQFQDFGRYNIHPLNRSLAQVLSESLRTSVNAGWITRSGFHGSFSVFDNAVSIINQGSSNTVYGAAVGYSQPNDQVGFDVGLGYISSMAGVNDVAAVLASQNVHNVSALAAYGDVNSGPFSAGVRVVSAIQSFSPTDLNTNATPSQKGLGEGAKPWAVDVNAGFGFNAWSKNQNLYASYQVSNDAVRIRIPKSRILAGYNIDMWKYTNLALEYTHDNAYSTSHGGTGESSNTVGLRGSVKFG